jgi:hypothetical protein
MQAVFIICPNGCDAGWNMIDGAVVDCCKCGSPPLPLPKPALDVIDRAEIIAWLNAHEIEPVGIVCCWRGVPFEWHLHSAPSSGVVPGVVAVDLRLWRAWRAIGGNCVTGANGWEPL